jgi:uncharacterized membrane protein YcjF (UPF0283 family)
MAREHPRWRFRVSTLMLLVVVAALALTLASEWFRRERLLQLALARAELARAEAQMATAQARQAEAAVRAQLSGRTQGSDGPR